MRPLDTPPATPSRRSRSPREVRIARRLLGVALALGGAGPAFATPCAGFADVEAASAYCSSVDWLKNRAITLGCTASLYCPDAPVTRLQMAAFMHRLGNALRPTFVHADELRSSFPGIGETVVCQASAAAAPYPRTATPASVSVTLRSPAAATAFAGLVVSFDNGTTWTAWSRTLSVFPSNAQGVASSLPPAAPALAVPAGQGVRFGIRPLKAAGGPDIDEAECEFAVRLDGGS